jgi:hypothetical protein
MGGQGAAIAQQPATPLHQRLVIELRRLVNEVWPINRPGGVAFLAEGSDTIWLVSKRSLDELRASMIGQGQTGIPPNPRIMDELMQHEYLNASQDDKAARRVRITIGDVDHDTVRPSQGIRKAVCTDHCIVYGVFCAVVVVLLIRLRQTSGSAVSDLESATSSKEANSGESEKVTLSA